MKFAICVGIMSNTRFRNCHRTFKAQLFKNVYRRSRDVEKGQEDYLNFHYQHYYALLDKIYSHYHLPKSKILYLDPGDMNDPAQWKIIIEQIEEAYQKNNAVITNEWRFLYTGNYKTRFL